MENPDKVSGLLTIVVEENDYKSKVEQKLKEYRRKANVPGFRPGQVPMGFIKRQYGELIQRDEIGSIVNDSINKYLQENKIGVLGTRILQKRSLQLLFAVVGHAVDLLIRERIYPRVIHDRRGGARRRIEILHLLGRVPLAF